MGTMQNILPWCLDMKEMTLRLKFDQKRLNSEIWVLWKLPKNSKQLFRSQLKSNMNFWLLWWLDLIEIDMKMRPNWSRKTQILEFGWLLKLPKSLGNCPKSQRVLSGLKLTWKWVASAWTGWQVPVWDPNHTQQRQTTVWRALRPTGQILGQLEKWLKFAWKWTKMTWKWFKRLGLGPSLYLEGIRPMFEAF